MIRLPDGMRDRLKQAAEQHGRSMNAEIVARLESVEELLEEFQMAKQAVHMAQEKAKYLEHENKALIEAVQNAGIVRDLVRLLAVKLGATDDELRAIYAKDPPAPPL